MGECEFASSARRGTPRLSATFVLVLGRTSLLMKDVGSDGRARDQRVCQNTAGQSPFLPPRRLPPVAVRGRQLRSVVETELKVIGRLGEPTPWLVPRMLVASITAVPGRRRGPRRALGAVDRPPGFPCQLVVGPSRCLAYASTSAVRSRMTRPNL